MKFNKFCRLCVLSALIFLLGCNNDSSSGVDSESRTSGFMGGVEIVTVDTHEYVFVKMGYGAGLAHKADCSSVDHR